MGAFFTRERFGGPQFIAAALLLIFLVQCLWLVHRGLQSSEVDFSETYRIREGLNQWQGKAIAGLNPSEPESSLEANADPLSATHTGEDAYHSPLWYLVSSAPLLLFNGPLSAQMQNRWGWLARAPFVLFGVLLGASLWYVARRLYGNSGGYIALMLYCFSPGIIRSAAVWFAQPEIGAAWGAFGTVFTAIAVAHTLYAPREVVLWNWRRILLLALSIVLAIGSQFSLLAILPLILIFMLYLAPTRRRAALTIFAAASAGSLGMLFAAYSFHLAAFFEGLRHAEFLGITLRAFGMPGAYARVAAEIGQLSPALTLALPAACITYAAWPRTRYFGNTAPLLVSLFFLALAVGNPHYPGLGFVLMAVPFSLVFVAGIFADLLETPQRALVMACLWGLLGANALWTLLQLARIPGA
ncbi:MAG TPA: hypothetical protein VFA89_09890 [Terriglobales bacterium]|nr:hypothetical protein [Terriglobales bacterium]